MKRDDWRARSQGAVICVLWLVIAVRAGLAQLPESAAVAPRPARQPDIFFVPTEEPVVYQMLELAQLTRDDVVYDLGSGDGRIVVLAAQKYGARGVGIELDAKLVGAAR
jgi:predicted RNA methylase